MSHSPKLTRWQMLRYVSPTGFLRRDGAMTELRWRPWLLAAVIHGGLLGLLLLGTQWQSQPVVAVQAELWSALPAEQGGASSASLPSVSAPPVDDSASIESPSTPISAPPPQPTMPNHPPDPAPDRVTDRAPTISPDIALKAERLAEKRRALAQQKELALKEKIQAEKEQQAKSQKEKEQLKRLEAQKAEAKQLEAKVLEAKALEAKQLELKQKAEQKMRQAEQKMRQAEMARLQQSIDGAQSNGTSADKAGEKATDKARQAELARLGIGGDGAQGQGTKQQTSGARGADYMAAIRAAILQHIVYQVNESNPSVTFIVTQLPTGEIESIRKKRSDGNATWDEAVERAIRRVDRLPKSKEGRVERELELVFKPRDTK